MSTKREALSEHKTALAESLETIARRHGWIHKGKPSITSVAKMLTSNICERRIKHAFENPVEDDFEEFDPWFSSKSEYAVFRIIDHLKTKLSLEGVSANISTEVRDYFGTYDVVIERNDSSNLPEGQSKRLKLEVKAGLSIALEQIERYLWETSPLILVRVITGQVMYLDPSELNGFTNFAVREAVEKAKRLLGGNHYVVPGLYCASCVDFSCEHNKFIVPSAPRLIKLSDVRAQEDAQIFFKNLPLVAERTGELVIRELTRKGSEAKNRVT